MLLSLSGWRSILQLSPMNQKNLKRLQFASMGLNIAAAVFALLEGQLWVAIGVASFIALLEIHSRWLLARIEAERSADRNTYLLLQNQKIDLLPSSFICRNCKYFNGRSGVICAVHPEGCVENKCGDFEEKK